MRIAQDKRLLFVWGTLQSYCGNNGYMQDAGAKFIGEAQMVEESAIGGLAMNIFPGCGMHVCGELWLVDYERMGRIDGLEGYSPQTHTRGSYYQQPVVVKTIDGTLHAAIAYTNDRTFEQLKSSWGRITTKYKHGTDYKLGTITKGFQANPFSVAETKEA